MPATGPLNTIGVVIVLPHNVWFATGFAVAVGFTVMVNIFDVPVQLKVSALFVKTGATVMLAVTGAVVVFVAVNDAMFPLPLAARPILVLSLNQL